MVDRSKKGPKQDSEEGDDFDVMWGKVMEQLGIDPEKVESRLQEQQDEDPDGSQITLRAVQATVAAKKVLHMPAPSPIIGTAIKQRLDEICKKEDLVLKAGKDNQKIEITKKEGIEFEDREMDETSYFEFHSLLTKFSYMVTIT